MKAAQWREYIIDFAIPLFVPFIEEYETKNAIDFTALKDIIYYLYNLLYLAYRVSTLIIVSNKV